MSNYDIDELRVIGHLGERCLGIFYTYINMQENINAVFFDRLQIGHPGAGVKPDPKNEDQVTIITAANNYYVPYLAVMIQSMLENISVENKYELYILHTDISEENQKKIMTLCKKYPQFVIAFYNMALDISNFSFKVSQWTGHISNETFYRLLIYKIFEKYDKIVYLDVDLIVKTDIASLYYTDLQNNLIGACIDGDFAGCYCSKPDSKKYTDEVLKIKNPLQYFQAGVTLVNIKEFRKTFKDYELVDMAIKNNYRWGDQDVLNVCCQGRVCHVDMSWNVIVQHSFDRISIIRRCPVAIYDGYMESRKKPKIIHFAGGEKPWDNIEMDFSAEFWEIARRSPFYEVIIYRLMLRAKKMRGGKTLMHFVNALFPYGSLRRKIIKKVFYTVSMKKVK
jgi:lipopolysaccharide biosynthesis glycosyltransferase